MGASLGESWVRGYYLTLWGQIMRINDQTLPEVALLLRTERKRQKLSRMATAAVCGVSTSFIRDAESTPENCTLGPLMKLITGLGLRVEICAHAGPQPDWPTSADFGVSDSQIVPRGASLEEAPSDRL